IGAKAPPCHDSPVSPETTDPAAAAVECNSAASPSHALAAASIEPAPGPAYMRPELISGGNAPKSISLNPSSFPLCPGSAGGDRVGGFGGRLGRGVGLHGADQQRMNGVGRSADVLVTARFRGELRRLQRRHLVGG